MGEINGSAESWGRRLTALLLSVVGLGISACATSNYGRDFDDSKATQIKVGVTTRPEVPALLGQPITRMKMYGQKTWSYNPGSVSSGTAGGAAKSAAGTVATTAIGIPVPGAGIFASLGTT